MTEFKNKRGRQEEKGARRKTLFYLRESTVFLKIFTIMSNYVDKTNFHLCFYLYEKQKRKRYLIQLQGCYSGFRGGGWWFCQGTLKEGLITVRLFSSYLSATHFSIFLIFSCSSDALMFIYSWSLRLWPSLLSFLENSFLHFTSLRGWPRAYILGRQLQMADLTPHSSSRQTSIYKWCYVNGWLLLKTLLCYN